MHKSPRNGCTALTSASQKENPNSRLQSKRKRLRSLASRLLLQEIDKSLICLKEAMKLGFTEWELLAIDNDMSRARGDPRYSAIVKDMRPKGLRRIAQDLGIGKGRDVTEEGVWK